MSKTVTLLKEQELYEAKWDMAARKAYKASHPDNFAGDDLDYPIKDANDVKDAWDLARGPEQDAIRAKVKAIANRLGLSHALPDTAKEESATASVIQAQSKPRKKIATLKVCFLEYNARSLNGRIYPKATCDAIYQSGVRKLADTNALPMTCFVSHEAANGNANTELVGAVRGLSQEGSKFYANIDLADTRVAWDQLALVEGKYMRSESMRVLGVDLKHDRDYDLPLVVPQETAAEVELMGIDLTTRPGLIDSARILQTLYESQQEPWNSQYTESFALDNVLIEQKEEAPMSQLPLYLKVILEEGLTPDRKAHQRIHDHLAGVMDATVKPIHGSESARLIAAVESELSEEGRAIAKQHAVRLAAAHDEAARQLGMDCESGYGLALDPDRDGDTDTQVTGDEEDDDGESHQERETIMTEQEMMEALKAKGFTIEAPKTKEQELQEALDAKLAEQERKWEEKFNAMQESATQRKTQMASSLNEESDLKPETLYEEGDYLAGTLAPKNWRALADRRVPWPQNVDPKMALHEMAPFLAYRLNLEEANARGRDIDQFISLHEQV